jgi:methyltransferase (TIGR00027 family)
VAIDLRHDWPAAQQRAGFDAAQPAAWSSEGLLAFLPPNAQDRLLDNISALSDTGSWFASENMPNANHARTTMQTQMQTLTDRWCQHGLDLDMSDLWYFGDRKRCGRLSQHPRLTHGGYRRG